MCPKAPLFSRGMGTYLPFNGCSSGRFAPTFLVTSSRIDRGLDERRQSEAFHVSKKGGSVHVSKSIILCACPLHPSFLCAPRDGTLYTLCIFSRRCGPIGAHSCGFWRNPRLSHGAHRLCAQEWTSRI